MCFPVALTAASLFGEEEGQEWPDCIPLERLDVSNTSRCLPIRVCIFDWGQRSRSTCSSSKRGYPPNIYVQNLSCWCIFYEILYDKSTRKRFFSLSLSPFQPFLDSVKTSVHKIDLPYVTQLTDCFFSVLAMHPKMTPEFAANVEIVNLTGCRYITDWGISRMVQLFPQLKSVSIHFIEALYISNI